MISFQIILFFFFFKKKNIYINFAKMKSISIITLFLIILFTISCLPGSIYSQSPSSPSETPPPPGAPPFSTPSKNSGDPAKGRVVSVAAAGVITALVALF
jgi:hypothetical protein